jgi:hypothetical protein
MPWALLGSVLCAGGCTTDLSGAEAFKGQVGRLQTIQREAWLGGERPPYRLGEASKRYGFIQQIPAKYPEEKFDPGQCVVMIESVKEVPLTGNVLGPQVLASGRIWTGPEEPAIRFEYVWGEYRTLHRAPWESLDTPRERFIDAHGRWTTDPRLKDASTYPTTH